MKKYIFIILGFLVFEKINAQIFLEKASIEFEVKTNVKKSMGGTGWAERMEDKIPLFKTEIYQYTFADNKSIYKFDRLLEKESFPVWMRNEPKNAWFTDFGTSKQNIEKDLIGSIFNIEDSLPKLDWRITNEMRNIAGFNCKKAVTKIFDSVYVFAFYTDEIMVSGGPGSINGLPGMIMGVTIPRLYTSWIATKVSVNGIDANIIKPANAKKYYNNKTFKDLIEERTKDWWSGGADDAETKQQKNRFVWGMLL
ncbi:MAG: GLPGLI family protein [Ferruginibacter sp.]|nr:GLPGLI family protein [Ferruginibacter sp.]